MLNSAEIDDRPTLPEPNVYRVEQDLVTARDIQRRLLPGRSLENGYLEAFGMSESCHAIGGDYFDVVEMEEEGTAFVVADVAGKGVSAALLGSVIQGGLAALAFDPDPARLVGRLNRYVSARSEANRYATAVVGVLDPGGTLECVNAGHHAALIVRNGRASDVLHSECFPIGMFANSEFASQSIRLEPGDTLVVFSDGLSEARNADGEEFGMARIAASLVGNDHLSGEDLAAVILEGVRTFCSGVAAQDDTTLLVLRYKGRPLAGDEEGR